MGYCVLASFLLTLEGSDGPFLYTKSSFQVGYTVVTAYIIMLIR